MMILAFETSTDICSVALQDGNGARFEKRIQGRSTHSDNVFLFTKALMVEHNFTISDLDAVLVSNGPGSYTGLRIAASAVKGMLFGTDVDLYAINTLAAFAMGVADEANGTTIHAIIDARRSHLYHQKFCFQENLKSESKLKIREIEEVEPEIKSDDVLIGTGISRLNEKVLDLVRCFGPERISALALITLFTQKSKKEFWVKTAPELLNPDYITSNQVNNSGA